MALNQMIDNEGRKKDLSIGRRSRTAARSVGCGHNQLVPGADGVKKGRPCRSCSWTNNAQQAVASTWSARSLGEITEGHPPALKRGAPLGPPRWTTSGYSVETAPSSLGARAAGVREQEFSCEPIDT